MIGKPPAPPARPVAGFGSAKARFSRPQYEGKRCHDHHPAKQKWIDRYQQQTSLTVYALEQQEAGAQSWQDFVVLNLDRWEQHSYNVLIDLRQDVPSLPRLAKLR